MKRKTWIILGGLSLALIVFSSGYCNPKQKTREIPVSQFGAVPNDGQNDAAALRIVPNPGQHMSTNTDATHFTSCKGYIRYKDCQFEGHGDDAANIHNYYLTIQKPEKGDGNNLVLKGADWHAQVLDYPDVADTMELVSRQTLEVVKKVVVKTVENDIPGY